MREDRNTAIFIAYEDHQETELAVPERELLRAILRSALLDVRRAKSAEELRKAKIYLLDGDEDYIFSFRSICQFLNLVPERIIEALGLGQENHDLQIETKNL